MGSDRKPLLAVIGTALLLAGGAFLAPAALAASQAVSLSFLAYDTASPGTIATAKLGEFVGKEVAGVRNVRTSNGGSKGNITRIAQGKGDLAATTLDFPRTGGAKLQPNESIALWAKFPAPPENAVPFDEGFGDLRLRLYGEDVEAGLHGAVLEELQDLVQLLVVWQLR